MSEVLKDLSELEPYRPGSGQCRTCKAIEADRSLGPAIAGSFTNGVGAAAIARVLRKHGYPVSERSLQYHLKNGHQTL